MHPLSCQEGFIYPRALWNPFPKASSPPHISGTAHSLWGGGYELMTERFPKRSYRPAEWFRMRNTPILLTDAKEKCIKREDSFSREISKKGWLASTFSSSRGKEAEGGGANCRLSSLIRKMHQMHLKTGEVSTVRDAPFDALFFCVWDASVDQSHFCINSWQIFPVLCVW